MASGRSESTPRKEGTAFLAGALTAAVIFSLMLGYLVSRIGLSTTIRSAGIKYAGLVLDIPDRLVDELRHKGAVIGNASNPTGARPHDTFLVQSDPELGFRLRPNVQGVAYVLKPRGPINLDPPVVYLETRMELSAELQDYLEKRTQVRTSFNTGASGLRDTLPAVESDRKILMVGDSALFGTGVDDEDTIASQLQALVGDAYQVVNAGVGAYDGIQAFQTARRMVRNDDYDLLIYAAHLNDFFEARHIASSELVEEVIARFASLKDEFPRGVIVSLVTYLHYPARHTLLEQGWRRARIESTDDLRRNMPGIVAAAGFEFIDFTSTLEELVQRERSVLSPFGFYCDRAHLSRRGTRRLSQQMFEVLLAMNE
jgi:hypothetical protein